MVTSGPIAAVPLIHPLSNAALQKDTASCLLEKYISNIVVRKHNSLLETYPVYGKHKFYI